MRLTTKLNKKIRMSTIYKEQPKKLVYHQTIKLFKYKFIYYFSYFHG